jgi:hypothetical protein
VQRQQEEAVEYRPIPAEIVVQRLGEIRAGVGEDERIAIQDRGPDEQGGGEE